MLWRISSFAGLGGFLFGYDLGLIGGALLELSEALGIRGTAAKEAIVGGAKFGACFGTFIGGALMLRYGRLKALAIESAFFVAGPIIMAASWGAG
jgi:MFS family permease